MKSSKLLTILLFIGAIALIGLLLWDCLTPSPYESLTINPHEVDWKSISFDNVNVNSVIQTLLSALLGFLLTVFFIEKLLKASKDKEINDRRQIQFKNISKIIRGPLIRYRKASLSMVYGIGNIPADFKIQIPIPQNALTNVFKPQAYADEPIFQTNIELYAGAVNDLQACITNILLNVDLSDNEELSNLLSDYTLFVSAINPCHQILDMRGKTAGKERLTDVITRDIPKINFEEINGSNIFLPFVRLKKLIEYHENFINTLYSVAPSFNIENELD